MSILKSSSPLLAQTSHPPTRNLFGKTHDASGRGATDDGVDDGIINANARLRASMMKMSMATVLGRARWQDDVGNVCADHEDGNNDGDVADVKGTAVTKPMM